MNIRIRTLALAAALAIAGAASARGGHDDHHGHDHHGHDHAAGHEHHGHDDHAAPKHGGVTVETKALDFEIVARTDRVQVYVGEHGKAVKLAGAKGKVTLLQGGVKSEAELVPVGDDYLEAKGSFQVGKGTKGIAVVSLPGKPAATARFELK
ncbi:MAG TPA: hypothetical protein VFM98_04935 [Ramlibacter sp.]|uniref:hypothetical protein n=1 Tax=Ramlibacter sp. TaxID=1917967 RepID=UPI002D7FC035|nr:hypothetical protein [Ramlibacter sp.]HET8744924.1 hypothetical protein [Ramlibacter sp.]